MHRATPLNSSFRAFTSGGARSAVDLIDDSKLMQEMGGNFFANEVRKGIEAPQNFGFTSVVMPAIKDALGNIMDSAEAVISFMSGGRSFPVAGVMDDRRHRLFNLLAGDTAMFSTIGRKLQLHFNQDGGFWTGPRDKPLRMQLLDEDSQQDQQQQQQQKPAGQAFEQIAGREFLLVSSPDQRSALVPSPRDTGSGSGGSSTSSGSGGQQKGQKPRYKDAQNSYRFVQVTKDSTEAGGAQVKLKLQDGNGYVHVNNDKKVYLGAESGKADFSKVVTIKGPAKNTLAVPE